MKILIFSSDYWPNNGGIAAHVYYLTNALAKTGMQVTMIGGVQKKNKIFVCSQIPAVSNFKEIVIVRKGPRVIKGILFHIEAFYNLIKLSRQKWDVIHFHNFVPDGLLLGTIPWPKAKIRIMTNHSSQYLIELEKNKSMFLYKFTTSSVNGFIGPSEELAAKTLPIIRSGQTVVYIPNGVDTSRFSPDNATENAYKLLGVDRTRKIILSIRRHSPKCGLEYLLRAVPGIIQKYPEAVFCLLGDGELTGELKKLTSELKLHEYVKFPGRVFHDNLPDVLRTSYATVLPSLYEAVSLSGLESMACGVPVIGTNVGGIPQFVIHNETGMLIEPASSRAIASAVIALIENPLLRDNMSLKARRLILEQFSWETVAQRTVDFYKSCDELV